MGRPILRTNPDGVKQWIDSETGEVLETLNPPEGAGMEPPATPRSPLFTPMPTGRQFQPMLPAGTSLYKTPEPAPSTGFADYQGPASIPGPDLRLAQPFSPPADAQQGISPDMRDKAYRYATGMFRGQSPGAIGPEAGMSPQQPQAREAAPAEDFARRYRQANEDEQQAMLALGFSRDFNQAMSTASTTRYDLMHGREPTKYGTGIAEAMAQNAQSRRQDLDTMESIDPASSRSRTISEVLKKMGAGDYSGLSAADIAQIAPLVEKQSDKNLKEANLGYLNAHRAVLEKQAGERIDISKDKNSRYNTDETKSLESVSQVEGELNLLEEAATKASTGPLAGRWTKISTGIGIASGEEAELNSDIKFHTLSLQRAMAGLRGAASPELHKLIEGLTPELYANPEQFAGVIRGIRKQMINERESILSVAATQGRTKGAEALRGNSGNLDALRQKLHPGEILVRDKATGKLGGIQEEEYKLDPSLYERQ